MITSRSALTPVNLALVALVFAVGCAPKPDVEPNAEAKSVKAPDEPAAPEADAESNPDEPETPDADAKPSVELNETLATFVEAVVKDFDAIAPERKAQLDKLALYVKTQRAAGETAKLTFICTHNSRRSHMSQLWAAVGAAYYGLDGVETFSGGTESTAFNPRAVAALERAGFKISKPEADADNPHYKVSYAANGPELEAFSKKYDDPPNPKADFAAVMTCSQADKNCPFVEGAEYRVAIPYVDPKASDGTPEESATYDERAKQIATEMFYAMSRVDEVEGTLVASSDAKPPEGKQETEHGLTWYLDRELAYAEAAKTGKPVFVDFFGSWCTPCKMFAAKTGEDEALNAALNDAVLLKVYDTSELYEVYKADERFPELKTSLPFFVVTDAEGKVLYKTTDPTKTDEMIKALGA